MVVLAPALTDETRNMCDAAFFAAMKPGSILVNIGRGGLVDEDALKVGLETDQPAHAVLDVFQTEPLPTDHWIWEHPKVRVTAHTSNSGQGTPGRGDDLFVANLEEIPRRRAADQRGHAPRGRALAPQQQEGGASVTRHVALLQFPCGSCA